MATRWEVEEAVLASSIEPTGRHILLTLLSRTNASTAEIPARHAPSFSDLESLTGYSRSTLIEWMKALGETHWFTRPILDGEAKPGMRLDVGDPAAARPKRSRTSKPVDPAYRLAVRTEVAAIPPGGMDRTAERYSTVPPGGTPDGPLLLKDFPTESQTLTDLDCPAGAERDDGTLGVDFGEPVEPEKPQRKSRDKKKTAPKGGPETHGQKVNRVAKLYTDNVKLVGFHGVRGVVDAAFKTGDYTEEQISTAISNMADARLPISQTSLRIAIEGLPDWNGRNNQPRSGSRGELGSTRHHVQDSHKNVDRFKEKI